MNAKEAIELVGALAQASSTNTLVTNGMKRGKLEVAAERELKAAKTLLKHLTPDIIDESELKIALGW